MTTFITEYFFPLITIILKKGNSHQHDKRILLKKKERPPHTDSKLHESRSKTGREVSFIMS